MSSVSVAFRYLLSLSFGLTGGAVFYLLGLPLPWMLGAMLLTLICSVSGLPLASPKSARPAMSAIIGVVLGTYFQPELFANVGEWLFSISALFVFIALAGGIGVSYFHFVGRMDWKTAYFAGMPGGLIEMVLAADANGADSRKVALVHSTRIFLTVMMLPPLVTWMEGAAGPASARPMMPVTLESVLLVACWPLAAPCSGACCITARYLMGPMLLCAVLNLSGVLHDHARRRCWSGAAQVVIGTVIGCRFIGVDWRHVIGVVS
ncbi:MAG: AbrB family transcriptional regulator [Alphaproteobacteria bacterium]|nr:AbrB family transcriptional regulator [Alphaproteobacteria bacterium]